MKNTLTCYIGLPASGKSHFARMLAEDTGAFYISSDDIRDNWYGNSETQGDNQKLFAHVYEMIVSGLNEGKDVVFDATNMSHKFRRILLQKVAKTTSIKKAIFVATPYEECLENNNSRERQVPEYVIGNMRKAFTPPSKSEGWDEIEIIWNIRDESKSYKLKNLFLEMDRFDQDNEHHVHCLGDHMRFAYRTLDENAPSPVKWATQLHDIGKLETKSFKTMKGLTTENAHYFSHESVGAYNAFFYLKNKGFDNEMLLEISLLIGLHMRPYFAKTDKAVGKIIRQFGEDVYGKIMMVHEADKASH